MVDLTLTFLSYFLMLLLKGRNKVEEWIDNHVLLSYFIAASVQIIASYCGIQVSYILQFFVGYFLARHISNKGLRGTECLVFIIIAIFLAGIRLVARQYIDGTILYDHIIAVISFNFLTLAVCAIVLLLNNKNSVVFRKLGSSKLWRICDLLSFPLYLTHYMFLQGDLSVQKLHIQNSCLEFLIFALCTFVLGMIVYVSANTCRKWI